MRTLAQELALEEAEKPKKLLIIRILEKILPNGKWKKR